MSVIKKENRSKYEDMAKKSASTGAISVNVFSIVSFKSESKYLLKPLATLAEPVKNNYVKLKFLLTKRKSLLIILQNK